MHEVEIYDAPISDLDSVIHGKLRSLLTMFFTVNTHESIIEEQMLPYLSVAAKYDPEDVISAIEAMAMTAEKRPLPVHLDRLISSRIASKEVLIAKDFTANLPRSEDGRTWGRIAADIAAQDVVKWNSWYSLMTYRSRAFASRGAGDPKCIWSFVTRSAFVAKFIENNLHSELLRYIRRHDPEAALISISAV